MEWNFLHGIPMWLVAIGILFARPNAVESPVLVTPHAVVSLSPKGEPVELSCPLPQDGNVSYQWYRSSSNSNTGGKAIDGATSYHYTTDYFPDKGIRLYYCVATSPTGVSHSSNVFAVAYTGLPTVKINTLNGEEPSAEYTYPPDGSYGRGITNATKVPASMQVIDSSGNLVYESGEYIKKTSGLTIKLRGNTSVELGGKSSYRLKLQKKADLLSSLNSRSGNSFSDKEWILHKAATSLNAYIGFTICDIAGVPWTPEYAFVNVVINNDYRGLYMLMEAIDRNESRVDVSEEGFIFERDAYWWNENVMFSTSAYDQKYTFKYPDDGDISEKQLSYIEGYMNTLESHFSDGSYDDYIDVESFARWLLIHDFLGSQDVAGSNIFLSKYDATDKTKLSMLTNWDFDWIFMQEGKWSLQHMDDRIYMLSMFKSSNRAFANMYKSLYDSLAPMLWNAFEKKWNDWNDAIGARINMARYCDHIRWNSQKFNLVEYDLNNAKRWFTLRETWLKNAIEKPHAIVYELNGGRFGDKKDFPDSINFTDRIEIPQPQKDGYIFAGWKRDSEKETLKKMVLHGYDVVDSVRLTANWLPSISFIKEYDDMSVKMDDFVGMEKFLVEVFSAVGSFLGYILLHDTDVRFILKTLREAGYPDGIYILRSKGLHMNRRVQLK